MNTPTAVDPAQRRQSLLSLFLSLSLSLSLSLFHSLSFSRLETDSFRLSDHRPQTKGRITQQSSPERDESNAFSKNVFLASTDDNNLGTEPKFELVWSNG
jgi:hypothetical protein